MHCKCCPDCPVAPLMESLVSAAQLVVKAALTNQGIGRHTLGEIEFIRDRIGLKPLPTRCAFEWIDGQLDCSGYFFIVRWQCLRSPNFVQSLKGAIGQATVPFPNRRSNASPKAYNVELHLSLWLAVELTDDRMLQNMIRQANAVIPPCVRLSLLLKSIRMGFERGVSLMLTSGGRAFSSECIKGHRRPVYLCIWELSEFVRTRYGSDKSSNRPQTCVNIFNMVLEYGSKYELGSFELSNCLVNHPFACDYATKPGSLYSVVWFLTDVAPFDVSATRRVIALTSPFLNFQMGGIYSPISMAFRNLRFFVTDLAPDWFSNRDLENILNRSVLDLMRAGALTSAKLDRELEVKPMAKIFSALSPALADSFISLTVESQLKPESLYEPPGSGMSTFQAKVNEQFPRSLASQCRHVFLRSLPVMGITARMDAIRTASAKLISLTQKEKVRLALLLGYDDLQLPRSRLRIPVKIFHYEYLSCDVIVLE